MLRYIYSFGIIIACMSALENDSIDYADTTHVGSPEQAEKLDSLDLMLPEHSKSGVTTIDTIVEKKPNPMFIPAPQYPHPARRGGVEGQSVVRALVDTDGRVTWVEILRSSGYSLLDDATLEAARKARFLPAIRDGRPVRVWVAMPYNFRLTEK